MPSIAKPISSARLAAVLVLWSASLALGLDTAYCSSQNTGSGPAFTWPYQSNGKCNDHCTGLGNFAFAVIQYTNCWCSNYIPAEQEDNSACNVSCPGYPAENCGSKDKGLYIYIKMAGTPSGTQGGSQPSSTDSAPQSSTRRVTSSSNPPTTTDQPKTSATVVTESGVIVTRTVVFTTATSSGGPDGKGGSSGSSTGAIVGGIIGGILLLLAIIAGVLFFLWRKKKQQQEQLSGEDGQLGLNRNTSTMSKNGLLGARGNNRNMAYPPMAVATSGSQGSRHDSESIGPMSASDRRFSQPVVVDSRLNPRAVLTFHGSNENRDSLDSIDDSRDYGRQLNVVNPDPTRD